MVFDYFFRGRFYLFSFSREVLQDGTSKQVLHHAAGFLFLLPIFFFILKFLTGSKQAHKHLTKEEKHSVSHTDTHSTVPEGLPSRHSTSKHITHVGVFQSALHTFGWSSNSVVALVWWSRRLSRCCRGAQESPFPPLINFREADARQSFFFSDFGLFKPDFILLFKKIFSLPSL